MKKYIFLLVTALALILCACGKAKDNPQVSANPGNQGNEKLATTATQAVTTAPTAATMSDDEIYEKFLSELCDDLNDVISDDTHLDWFRTKEGMIGISQIAYTPAERIKIMETIGYTFIDLNNDGSKELLVGVIDEKVKETWVGKRILCAYTVSDGQLALLWEGSEKHTYSLLDDLTVYYNGKSSAAEFGFGIFTLEKGSTALTCNEFYFNDYQDSDEFSVYTNTTGQCDTTASQLLNVDMDAFYELDLSINARTQSIELTPLGTFGG